MEKVTERVEEPVGMEDTRETRPSKHNRTSAQGNSQKVLQHAQGQHRPAPDGVLEPNKVNMSPAPPISSPEAIST